MEKEIILHHTAVSRQLQDKQLVAVNNYHKEKWDFMSSLGWYVGYQYFIDCDGTLTQCRDDNEEGAHTIGHNHSIGICWAGNGDTELPTGRQLEVLKNLLNNLVDKYGISVQNIYNHRKFASYKSCPGSLLPNNWGQTLMIPYLIRKLNYLKEILLKLIKGRPNK